MSAIGIASLKSAVDLLINGGKQAVFDEIARRVVAQQRAAVGSDGSCVYQAPDGARCAVGLLMSDQELGIVAKQNLNSTGIYTLFHRLDLPSDGDQRHFLSELQHCHDLASGADLSGEDFCTAFIKEMRRRASYDDLYTDVLDELEEQIADAGEL